VRLRPIPPLCAAALAAVLLPAGAQAAGGGGVAPTDRQTGSGEAYGGAHAEPGQGRPEVYRRRRSRRPSGGPRLTSFELHRTKLFLYGRSARLSFAIAGGPVRARLALLSAEDGGRVATIDLGELEAGEHALRITGTETGILAPGRYQVRLSGRDRRGRALRQATSASRSADLYFFHHKFPIVGEFDFGGDDARFGALREGHRHQGQDLTAAEGTPVVAPRGGVVETVEYQRKGAGHYVVVDGKDEDRDYVFMHLRDGSIQVAEGEHVRTGQRLGEVGNTGASSGPHLHFEIWVGGWWAVGGEPVDPLPLLRSWALATRS
jgi:murein DD-endopeptidase MepM/ murein hydrolase activator NlpD